MVANVCRFCNETFDSRNALFKHLRSSRSCFEQLAKLQAAGNDGGRALNRHLFGTPERHKVAIQFGYWIVSESDNDGNSNNANANEIAAELVCKAFLRALENGQSSSLLVREEGEDREALFTLSSAAKLRHPSLVQEGTCCASTDVIGVNYKGGPKEDLDGVPGFVNQMQILAEEFLSKGTKHHHRFDSLSRIKVLAIKSLAVATKFHAEKNCTQRAYQYLLPVQWIDSSADTREWIHAKTRKMENVETETSVPTRSGTPPSIVRLKKMLKLVESRDVTQVSASPAALVSSAGRYGNLWKKERRPFHNFCDPSLGSGSMASPSNENSWRSVDKCRLDGFVIDEANEKEEPFLVIEIRGDGFVVQQVRRIVATVVAMANGWLPVEFLQTALRADFSIETPIAPEGLLYLSSARFHFLDLVLGSPLFHESLANRNASSWLTSLQSKLLQRWNQKDLRWLDKLRDDTSPRIRSAFEKLKLCELGTEQQVRRKEAANTSENDTEVAFSIAPEPYLKTLSLLRNIRENKNWPRTSDSRSRLIRSPGRATRNGKDPDSNNAFPKFKARAASSEFQGHLLQCGSFTVVNPKSFDGNIPSINKRFPELVQAVFELESHCLSNGSQSSLGEVPTPRSTSASTHCIINRNVEFTPHFLNGKGKESCYSTIVGLGDYTGGGFVVDGESYDIRYEPLRYDGWKQIHSAEVFRGERFSLVWFTPERREDILTGGNVRFEDAKAKLLCEKHNARMASYPSLMFRPNSTDALVVNEILDSEKGCDYELSQQAWSNMIEVDGEGGRSGFFLRGHDVVLDIGAHIGVFSRYAISAGCKKVIAFEPELENAKLLEENLKRLASPTNNAEETRHIVKKCAVAHGEAGLSNFVNARNRTDGSLNSWRHSLEKYTSYVDKKGANMISTEQDAILARSRVQTIPFFGNDGALQPGVTFVKMDCEGAEIDILLAPESSCRSKWLDATHLVFEWSFTKEKRVGEFHKALNNLRSSGFDVVYQGQGSWWDAEPNCMWPYHTDLIVFARRRN